MDDLIDHQDQLNIPATQISPPSSDSSSDSHQATSECVPSTSLTRPSLPRSSRSSPCITFAPLPELSPRRRRGGQPLGVAARSQFLQNRREQRGALVIQQQDDVQCSPMWPNEEPGDEMEDPFLVLGRMVKGAGRGLWRSLRPKKGRKKDEGGEGAENGKEEPLTVEESVAVEKSMAAEESMAAESMAEESMAAEESMTVEEELDGGQSGGDEESTLVDKASIEPSATTPSDEDRDPLKDDRNLEWMRPTTVGVEVA